MRRVHYFVDEAGNFHFTRKNGASKYFILTSVMMEDCYGADSLIALRRELEWSGVEFSDGTFHATSDKQRVRDEVFQRIAVMDIRVDATIFEKSKTVPSRQSMLPLYKLAWFNHAKHNMSKAIKSGDELHVIAASLGDRAQTKTAVSGIRDVVEQCGRDQLNTQVRSVPASVDPGLQVADYCCWAIQRKWEGEDDRSWQLIKDKIGSEYDFFRWGTTHYY